MLNKFDFLRTFFSPFKRPKLKWYFGKIRIGTPIFYPRRWVKSKEKPGYERAIPRKIGFDFVALGYKLKWDETDYRFEWAPVWSFVFFKWQIAVMFIAPHQHHYWRCWLTYYFNTNPELPDKKRIEQAKKINPEIYTRKGGEICYWDKVLK